MRLSIGSSLPFLICFCALCNQAALASDPDLPQMTTQPKDQVVSFGDTANFNALVSSASSVAYQWWFNGIPLTHETNLNLSIPDCTRAESGWYVLKAKNDAGQIASKTVFLTVQGEPAGSIQFRNSTGNRVVSTSGGNASGVSIRLFAGPTPDRLSWTGASAIVNNGLYMGETISLPFAAPGETVFVRADLTDGQVSNLIPVIAGNGFVGGSLDALRFPTFNNWPSPIVTSEPSDSEIDLGDVLELNIEFVDYSEVTVKWIKDGNPEPVFEEIVELSAFTTTKGSSTLRIPAANLSDAGNYKVVLLAAYGDTIHASETANVSVVLPAEGHITSIIVADGRALIEASGRPNRTYTLEFRSPDSDWLSIFPRTSPTGLLNFPPFSLPNDHSWFRLRSSN